MSVSTRQAEAILNLPPAKRYSHFIKKVVGWRKMWGLYNDGWAMSGVADGLLILPLWPEREYAERCIGGEWAGYEPRAIDLADALENMLPTLRERGIQPGVFFLVGQGSIDVSIEDLEQDLRTELLKYT